jgi:hypothetical protein
LQAKRESWLSDKTKEIKDVTIKGLEPEVHALVQRHRQEAADLQDRCAADAKRQMDALSSQHDVYVRCATACSLELQSADAPAARIRRPCFEQACLVCTTSACNSIAA